jgi:hypothetical protein
LRAGRCDAALRSGSCALRPPSASAPFKFLLHDASVAMADFGLLLCRCAPHGGSSSSIAVIIVCLPGNLFLFIILFLFVQQQKSQLKKLQPFLRSNTFPSFTRK